MEHPTSPRILRFAIDRDCCIFITPFVSIDCKHPQDEPIEHYFDQEALDAGWAFPRRNPFQLHPASNRSIGFITQLITLPKMYI